MLGTSCLFKFALNCLYLTLFTCLSLPYTQQEGFFDRPVKHTVKLHKAPRRAGAYFMMDTPGGPTREGAH